MAEQTRSNKMTWIIIAIVVIVILLFAGLLPMPGQKDNVTPSVQPSPAGTQPKAELPKGPGEGATSGAAPGSATDKVSEHTMTDAAPAGDANPKQAPPAK